MNNEQYAVNSRGRIFDLVCSTFQHKAEQSETEQSTTKAFLTYKGSTNVRPRFSRNFQDCKTAVWKDTQTPNLLPEFIFFYLKRRLQF